MNEQATNDAELRQEFAELVRWLREESQEGMQALKKEMPVVAREIVVYERVTSTVAVSSILLAPLFLYLLTRAFFVADDANSEGECAAAIAKMLVSGSLAVVCVISALSNISTFLKAWFAPSLVVLDYLKGLL